jgi:mRNA-degrading endonuclease toxin of MazEF toxin-antitoxin module
MTYSRGDVVWLRVDNIEGGLGKPHPAIVISSNTFNDSHSYGFIVRGSSRVPAHLAPDEYVIERALDNGLDADTVFLPIIQSAEWTRVLKKVGAVTPYQLGQIMGRLRGILEL